MTTSLARRGASGAPSRFPAEETGRGRRLGVGGRVLLLRGGASEDFRFPLHTTLRTDTSASEGPVVPSLVSPDVPASPPDIVSQAVTSERNLGILCDGERSLPRAHEE